MWLNMVKKKDYKSIKSIYSQKILITGGHGFLGSALIIELKNKGYTNLIYPTSKEYDLLNQNKVDKLFQDFKNIDILIHLVALSKGLGFNKKYPSQALYNNLLCNTFVLHNANKYNIKKVITIGSVCAYPENATIPYKEEEMWEGYPEEINAPYGLAKRIMIIHGQLLRKQYGLNVIHPILSNLYGPKDNFDLESSHVIPALIRKFTDAKINNSKFVEIWGDGSATREFLFVEDAVKAIILMLEKYNKSDPINIGSGEEISIKQLVKLIKKLTGFHGKIIWNKSKPKGQPKRYSDTSKAQLEFGFKSETTIEEGLKKTFEWYLRNRII